MRECLKESRKTDEEKKEHDRAHLASIRRQRKFAATELFSGMNDPLHTVYPIHSNHPLLESLCCDAQKWTLKEI